MKSNVNMGPEGERSRLFWTNVHKSEFSKSVCHRGNVLLPPQLRVTWPVLTVIKVAKHKNGNICPLGRS